MTMPVLFLLLAVSLLGVVGCGLAYLTIVTRLRHARHRRALDRREADLRKWCLVSYPSKSRFIPREDVDSGSQFAVGRDCFADRKGVWKL